MQSAPLSCSGLKSSLWPIRDLTWRRRLCAASLRSCGTRGFKTNYPLITAVETHPREANFHLREDRKAIVGGHGPVARATARQKQERSSR